MESTLNELPIDLFIKYITYLPFSDVNKLCSTNLKLRSYCTNPKYNNRWKNLIDNTFSGIYNYQYHLDEIRQRYNLPNNSYNYLIYTQLIKNLDPITQLMIYYRQGDIKSFNDKGFNDKGFNANQRLLSKFILSTPEERTKYLTDRGYSDTVDSMLFDMVTEGNIKGVEILKNMGGDIVQRGEVLLQASFKDNLEMVKYLLKQAEDNKLYIPDAIFFAKGEKMREFLESYPR